MRYSPDAIRTIALVGHAGCGKTSLIEALLHQGGARWPDAFKRSIGVALKDEEDLAYVSGRLDAMLAESIA